LNNKEVVGLIKKTFTIESLMEIQYDHSVASSEYILSNNGFERRELIAAGSNQLNQPLKIYSLLNGEKVKSINLLKFSSVNCISSLSFTSDIDNSSLSSSIKQSSSIVIPSNSDQPSKGYYNYIFVGEKKNLSVYDIEYGKLHKNFKTSEKITCIKVVSLNTKNVDSKEGVDSKGTSTDKYYLVYCDLSGMIYCREINNWQKYSTLNVDPTFLYDISAYSDSIAENNLLVMSGNSDELFFVSIENSEITIKNQFKLSSFKENVSESTERLESLVAPFRENVEIFNVILIPRPEEQTPKIMAYCSNRNLVLISPPS